jgi:hypothetical protein
MPFTNGCPKVPELPLSAPELELPLGFRVPVMGLLSLGLEPPDGEPELVLEEEPELAGEPEAPVLGEGELGAGRAASGPSGVVLKAGGVALWMKRRRRAVAVLPKCVLWASRRASRVRLSAQRALSCDAQARLAACCR